MGKRAQVDQFERIALEASVFANPAEETAKHALRDWLMEHGFSLMSARRRVAQKSREGFEDRQRERVYRWLDSDGWKPGEMRVRIRRRASGAGGDCLPIEVVGGGRSPLPMASAGRWFDSATGSVLVRGSDVHLEESGNVGVYVYRVVVGAAWVIALADELGFEIPQ